MEFDKNELLGKNSYSTIVKEIYEKIQKTEGSTMTGNEFLKEIYKNLSESSTPVIELREFRTKAEKIAKEDTNLADVLKFIEGKVNQGSADLNFLINLCKEEHFVEMKKLNHPAPKETIAAIKDMFGETGSVIEQGIRTGLFDTLKSNLLGKIKNDIDVKPAKKETKLNENTTIIDNIAARYNPVGLTFNDLQNNRTILMFESQFVQFDSKTKKLTRLDESAVTGIIPETYNKLMSAINSCAYNPENQMFNLNEAWDFEMSLHPDGKVTINDKPIEKAHVKKVLFESVQAYTNNPTLLGDAGSGFNKLNYLHDADNFVALVENSQALTQFTNVTVLKNMNENTFAIFANNEIGEKPSVLASNIGLSDMSESFGSLVGDLNEKLGFNVTKMFESQLLSDQEKIAGRNKKLMDLKEQQKEIGAQLDKVQQLKGVAAEGSPQLKKLNEQEQTLTKKGDEVLNDLNFYQNQFRLYES